MYICVLCNSIIVRQRKESYIALRNTRIAQIPTLRGTYNIYTCNQGTELKFYEIESLTCLYKVSTIMLMTLCQ